MFSIEGAGPGHHGSREWLPPPSGGTTGPGVVGALGAWSRRMMWRDCMR
ncbi:MAG: hypothetical protein P1P72_11245 [ANME-2 cluster archaeon]|nr:hypothetical protein [ANME-2 cluster archaeon]